MGERRQDHRWPRGGHGKNQFSDPWQDAPPGRISASRLLRPVSWIVVIAGLVVWSLLAWIGYALVDPILGWVAASAGVLVDSGKGLATSTGMGKEVGSVVDGLNVSGLLGQAIALLRVVVKPAIVVLWTIGVLALFAAPVILPRIGQMVRKFRR